MPTIEEIAKELTDVFNITSGTEKPCKVVIIDGKIELDYFNAKHARDERKVLTVEEADELIQAIYNLYRAKRGQKLNPTSFKDGVV